MLRQRITMAVLVSMGLVACSQDAPQVDEVVDTAGQAHDRLPDHGSSGLTNPFASAPKRVTPLATNKNNQDAPSPGHDSDPVDESLAGNSALPTQPQVEGPKVSINVDANGLSWETDAATYQAINVRVAGPDGLQISKSFKNGELAQVYQSLPDGTYNWQAVTQPEIPDWVREQMREVRASGDYQAERKLIGDLRAQGYLPSERQAKANVQSGYFNIRNGEIARTDIEER